MSADTNFPESGEDQSLKTSIEASREFSSRLKVLIPNFRSTLELLESGAFIASSTYIKAYKEMSRHHDAYTNLLEMIGQELVYHRAGFYYLMPKENQVPSKRERQVAATIFALIEFMSDKGFPIESMITTEEPINENDILLVYETFAERLDRIGLDTFDKFMSEGFKRLVETGVLVERPVSTDKVNYALGLPAYFYIDIARQVHQAHQTKQEADQDALFEDLESHNFIVVDSTEEDDATSTSKPSQES